MEDILSNQEILKTLHGINYRISEIELIQLKDSIENEYFETFDRLYTDFANAGYVDFLAYMRAKSIYLFVTGKFPPWCEERDFEKVQLKMKGKNDT